AQLVMQKVERPALVGTLRHGQRCPGAERPLATAATADLKPFLDIEAAQLLVIQHDALAPQQDVQPPIAKAPPHSGDLAQPGANDAVISSPAAVADRTAVHADRLACPPLAHPVDLAEMSGGLSSGGGRHHFLAATSRSIALSSIASAKSFFSLAFSCSSTFRSEERRVGKGCAASWWRCAGI